MILEEATYEAFGHCPSTLKHKSHKHILAACELCGEFREIQRYGYSTFCKSCSGMLGGFHKGDKSPLFGRTPWNKGKNTSEEVRQKQSKAHIGIQEGAKHPMYGKRGSLSPLWKEGRRATTQRYRAKRKGLSYIPLNPSFQHCDGHHIMCNFLINLPPWIHREVSHNINTFKGMMQINVLAVKFLLEGF